MDTLNYKIFKRKWVKKLSKRGSYRSKRRSRAKKYRLVKNTNRAISNFIIGDGIINKRVSDSKSLHRAAFKSTGIVGKNMSPTDRSFIYNIFRVIYALSFIWLIKILLSWFIGIIK